MKKRLIPLLLLILGTSLVAAQEKTQSKNNLNNVVNTLKDRLTLEGYAQVAYSYDDTEGAKANTFEVKRAILMVRGKITDKWSCYFMYNFANTSRVLEAYTEYKFLPELTVRIGEFKTMFSFENPMSPCFLELINCNSQAVNYLAGYDGSDPLYGSHTGRDLGLMVYGDLFDKLVTYHVALMNGQGINRKDSNNQKDIVGSLLVNPLSWLSVGGSFIKGKGCAVATSAVNPDIGVGQNYDRNRWTAGFKLHFKPIDVRSEYLQGKDGHVKSEGYYLTLSAHVLPKFDIIASYDYFNRNKTLEDKQTNYVAGVQWWFYPKCRLQLQYTYRDPHLRKASNLLQAQVQVRF